MACNRYAGIAWHGEYLRDFWMWNGQYIEYKNGIKYIQTVKVDTLKEAALKYWRDGWVPVKEIDEHFLRRLEQSLREHPGLKKEGVRFPDTPFLKAPEKIPLKHLGPEVRAYLGLKQGKIKASPKEEAPGKIIEFFKKTRGM